MEKQKIESFDLPFCSAGLKDIGQCRRQNQDEIVLSPDIGFFAVSDGMGGLAGGDLASRFVATAAPKLMGFSLRELPPDRLPEVAAAAFEENVRILSDNLYKTGNTEKHFTLGATFSGLWLLGQKAIFVNLGDSRAYLLSRFRRVLTQISEDHNIAGILCREGLLSREEARSDPRSSKLTAFVGMKPPAEPESYIVDLKAGDRILLCSDGLYGMVEECEMARLLRSSQNPERVCRNLIDKANEHGGRDNISAVYLRILPG